MVLVNFGVLTTGFDAPRASAVVIARPTASLVLYSQMVGRGNPWPQGRWHERMHNTHCRRPEPAGVW